MFRSIVLAILEVAKEVSGTNKKLEKIENRLEEIAAELKKFSSPGVAVKFEPVSTKINPK